MLGRVEEFLPGLLVNNRDGTTVYPALSKPDIGRGPSRPLRLGREESGRNPSWPGVADSTKGRIHWRRPNCHSQFLLAILRWTIHTDMRRYPSLYYSCVWSISGHRSYGA